MIHSIIIIIYVLLFVDASHFRGGQITWKPVTDNGATVTIQFTARWSWRRSYYGCTDSTITSGTLVGPANSIICDTGCKVLGESIGTTDFYCTKYDATEDWTMGEKTWTYTVPKVADYEASFTGGAWIALQIGGNGNWEIRTMLNTLVRTDTGTINSSPLSSMAPVVRLRQGFIHKITIPTADADDDDVRCRWSTAAKSECDSVCGVMPSTIATLSTSCELLFDARTTSAGWYAAAISIEDYSTTTSQGPFSVVGLQFLVYVVSVTSSCVTPPVILGDRAAGACIGVPLGTTVNERIVGQVGCSSVSMYDIQIIGPSGTSQTTVAKLSGTTDQYFVTISWTPVASQYGPNIICAKAIDSTFLSSDNYCFTVLAGIKPPTVVTGSGSPSGLLSTALLTSSTGTITWSVKFDQTVSRPTKPAYIFFYDSTNTLLFKMDASVFPTVSYSSNTLTFTTGNSFSSGSYYILLDYGLGVGSQFCKPESDAVKSTTFWTFSVAATTTTTLATQTTPKTIAGVTLGLSGISSTASPILPVGATLSTTKTGVTVTTISSATAVTNAASGGAATTAASGGAATTAASGGAATTAASGGAATTAASGGAATTAASGGAATTAASGGAGTTAASGGAATTAASGGAATTAASGGAGSGGISLVTVSGSGSGVLTTSNLLTYQCNFPSFIILLLSYWIGGISVHGITLLSIFIIFRK